MLQWLKPEGGDFADSVIGRTDGKGMGVFAGPKGILPNSLIARIPTSAIMSIARSRLSAVGIACEKCFLSIGAEKNTAKVKPDDSGAPPRKRLAPSPVDADHGRVPGELILFLDMVHGRFDPSHPHHCYLSALPSIASDLSSWPEADLLLLGDSRLARLARHVKASLVTQFERWLGRLRKIEPGLFEHCSLENLDWARGMYRSRRYPLELLGVQHDSVGEHIEGIMVPWLDMLNHSPQTSVRYVGPTAGPTGNTKPHAEASAAKLAGSGAIDQFVSCYAGPKGVPAGAEVFNQYGAHSNEELLFAYGFTLSDNVHDTYKLFIPVPEGDAVSGFGSEEKTLPRQLGPYDLHRTASPSHAQFPRALWSAIDDPKVCVCVCVSE